MDRTVARTFTLRQKATLVFWAKVSALTRVSESRADQAARVSSNLVTGPADLGLNKRGNATLIYSWEVERVVSAVDNHLRR